MNERTNELQLWNEQDVLGAMASAGSVSTALLKNLVPEDFKYAHTRHIYKMMKDSAGHRGKFNAESLLSNDLEANKTLIYILDCSVTTNARTKCDWLVGQSIKTRG